MVLFLYIKIIGILNVRRCNNYEKIKISKNLQFANLNYGLNNVALNDTTTMKINIVGSNSFNFYNVMRIIQTILGLVMILLGGYTFMQVGREKLFRKISSTPLILLMSIGMMALYNGLTSTCSISILLEDYLN